MVTRKPSLEVAPTTLAQRTRQPKIYHFVTCPEPKRNIFTSAKEDMQSSLFVCLFVCLFVATLRKNFRTDLHEIFTVGWQWASEQVLKFWWRSNLRIRIRIRIRIGIRIYYPDLDPYCDSGKTYLGGGVHSPSASSLSCDQNEL